MKPNFRYDSRYESEYKQRIQETVEYVLDKKYGDTISFESLAKLLHYSLEDEHETKKFKSTMGRVKQFLIEKGYILKSIAGVGYYILKPKQISGYCYHTYIRRTKNLLEKSGRILKYTDQTELSEIRQEEYDNVCDLNLDTMSAISTTIENSKYYANKHYYESLED